MTEHPNSVEAYPLNWPAGWARTDRPESSRFGARSVNSARIAVEEELCRLGATQVVMSTNVELRLDGLPRSNRRAPDDRGVAVYFLLEGRPTVLACDRWLKVEDNLWAIAKHVEAMRGMVRWGVGRMAQAFTGYQQIEAPGAKIGRHWREVFGVGPRATLQEVHEVYTSMAKRAHPDNPRGNGSEAAMRALNLAYEDAKRELDG